MMLMDLVWSVWQPVIVIVVTMTPEPPEPWDLTVPWPTFVPTTPFGALGLAIVTAAAAVMVARFVIRIYKLIPFL